jgi:hypothetical protein
MRPPEDGVALLDDLARGKLDDEMCVDIDADCGELRTRLVGGLAARLHMWRDGLGTLGPYASECAGAFLARSGEPVARAVVAYWQGSPSTNTATRALSGVAQQAGPILLEHVKGYERVAGLAEALQIVIHVTPERLREEQSAEIQPVLDACLRDPECGSRREAAKGVGIFEDEQLAVDALLAFAEDTEAPHDIEVIAHEIVYPLFLDRDRRTTAWLVDDLAERLPFPKEHPHCELIAQVIAEAKERVSRNAKRFAVPEALQKAHEACTAPESTPEADSVEGETPQTDQSPQAKASTKAPILLEPVHRVSAYASSRWMLSNGDIVQMQSGCGEWSGYGEGFLVQFSRSKRDPPIVEFVGGWSEELTESGYLLLFEQKQVGNDGTDAPLDKPSGAEAHYGTTTGAIYVSRVSVVNLDTGNKRNVGWDTFEPMTSGNQRYVVYASAAGPAFQVRERELDAYWVWDLESGKRRKVADSSGKPAMRTTKDAVLVRVVEAEGARFIEIDMATGKAEDATAERWEAADEAQLFTAHDQLGEESPAHWRAESGRRIVVPPAKEGARNHAPRAGGCTLGPYWGRGFLFADEGLYRWPDGVTLERQ